MRRRIRNQEIAKFVSRGLHKELSDYARLNGLTLIRHSADLKVETFNEARALIELAAAHPPPEPGVWRVIVWSENPRCSVLVELRKVFTGGSSPMLDKTLAWVKQ